MFSHPLPLYLPTLLPHLRALLPRGETQEATSRQGPKCPDGASAGEGPRSQTLPLSSQSISPHYRTTTFSSSSLLSPQSRFAVCLAAKGGTGSFSSCTAFPKHVTLETLELSCVSRRIGETCTCFCCLFPSRSPFPPPPPSPSANNGLSSVRRPSFPPLDGRKRERMVHPVYIHHLCTYLPTYDVRTVSLTTTAIGRRSATTIPLLLSPPVLP